ncbi:MAG: DUF1934 domain-containing protein [Clostridia bacterium]|nr:DUF1934 domain-containing protein [Clostridia bacterium]
MLTKKDVMISIQTVRQGIPVPLFSPDGGEAEEFDEEDLPETYEDETDEEDGPESSEIMMEGRIVTTSRRVELIYHETELTGMEGSVTKIGFEPNTPELISMLRGGSVSTALIFEPHQRHVCVYNTPFSSFEVCVHTLEVKNQLLECGELFLDYLIEIHGARTERCKMTLKYHEI